MLGRKEEAANWRDAAKAHRTTPCLADVIKKFQGLEARCPDACARPRWLRGTGHCTPPAEMAPAAEITRFAVEGRLQVRDAERSAAVGFDWQHDGPRDEWLFTGPLGPGHGADRIRRRRAPA